MPEAKQIVSGAGTRYGQIFILDSDGFPIISSSTATPNTGYNVSGIKSTSAAPPAPRRINHLGNDEAYAQDSLPPTEVGSFGITTSKTNLPLDAALDGTEVRVIDNLVMRAVGHDKDGDEPLASLFIYRQAKDTDPESDTYGRLRQWNWRFFPSGQIKPQVASYESEAVDQTYEGTPSKVNETPWGETINNANWGVERLTHIEGVSNYQPVQNWWKGNGTLDAFSLSVPPKSSDELVIWNATAGTKLTPSSVDISTTNPAFTLSSVVAEDHKIMALIGTEQPGAM